jgi:hypothetical protein
MKKSEWGPIIWTTLHVFTIHVKDSHFQEAKKELIETIISIMSNLPCPSCSNHAISMVKKYRMKQIQTKEQLIKCLFHMHNEANKRLKKKIFNYEDLIKTYQNLDFKQVMTRYYDSSQQLSYSEKMMMYNFHRRQFLSKFKKYINMNIQYFVD